MSARDFAKRFSSLMLAALFLLTTIGFSGLIYLQTKQQSDDDATQAAIQEALKQQGTEDSLNQTGENMLQGTQLAGFTPTANEVTELQKIDIVEGDGDVVPEGATITAHYTGAFVSDGLIFQSSKDTGQPATFGLDGVIAGWTAGVPGMKVGGTRRLVIPAEQAYGVAPDGYVYDASDPSARPLGPLVFDIELVSMEQ